MLEIVSNWGGQASKTTQTRLWSLFFAMGDDRYDVRFRARKSAPKTGLRRRTEGGGWDQLFSINQQ